MIGREAELAIEPRVPPEGLASYKVRDAAQSIYLGFRARRETLQEVAFHRPAD
jgi:hypothetical protein